MDITTVGLDLAKNVFQVLNRIYRGRIVHKDKHYPGEHEAIVDEALWDEVSFLKTSSAAEYLAFQPTAGYRLQHANDRRDPRRLRPRDCPEPRNVTAGKHRPPPPSGGPEAGKTTAVA